MGFFDRFKKKKNVSVVPVNNYYNGNNSFTFIFDDMNPDTKKSTKLFLSIENSVNMGGVEAYECSLYYAQTGGPSLAEQNFSSALEGFEKVIICFDKDRMINEEKYTEFVCSKILNFDRIKKLHDNQFGLSEGKKCGNYVGSVLESNGSLSLLMDDNIGDIANASFGNSFVSKSDTDNNSLEETIQSLREERDKLRDISNDHYQSSKNK